MTLITPLRHAGLSMPASALALLISLVACSAGSAFARQGVPDHPLTIVAIGNAGETGGALRGNASYMTDMYTGENNGGKYDVMLFLGNNFTATGLNIPAAEVEGTISGVLDRYKVPFGGLGRQNIHAIPGNQDYYARNAFASSVFFGLFRVESVPVGISDRGNQREAAIDSWTYHDHMPGQAVYAAGGGNSDSVQLIFFDSALLLRTPHDRWHPMLDSLRHLALASSERPGIVWRIFCTHHPLSSVGEHAGYTVWDDETNSVARVTGCDKDSNSVRWLENWLEPQDLCTDRYRRYVDSVKAIFQTTGVRIQAVLSAYDNSLQLIDGQAGGTSFVQIVSGAGSAPARVRFPAPPHLFTSALTLPENQGMSLPGFVQLRFDRGRMRVIFFNGKTGDPLDMGGGKKEFWINRNGTVEEE